MERSFKELLEQKTAETEAAVYAYLPEEKGFQKTIFEAMNYSVKAGGKRLRPLLMMETYRMLGGKGKEILPFMAAIEMIHTSSLIHDDLPCMDNDELRRGKPTTWKVYGYDMAVLAGDALMIFAFETAAKALSLGGDPERVARAMGILAEKTGIYGMIGGQTVDVELTGKPVPEEQLSFIYRLKTGALLEASMRIGAVLAGVGKEEEETVERIAADVGMAFQIQDDILDFTRGAETGKPSNNDLREHKITLPLLLLLPFEQKPRKGKKALSAAAQRWGVLAVCLAAGVIIYALLTGYTALASNYGRVPYANTGVDPGRQLAFVFSNLPRYLAVLLYSVYRDKANLFTIGNFGWMDMTVPFVSYFAPLFLLFASGVSALEGAREKLRTAWVFLATAVLMYGFTYTGMYLTSTPVSLPEINGVQTRYLLGALFALFALASMLMGRTMALQNLRPGLPQKTPPAWRVLHYGFCFALVSALLLFQAYYIGP